MAERSSIYFSADTQKAVDAVLLIASEYSVASGISLMRRVSERLKEEAAAEEAKYVKAHIADMEG
jgi:hypothetical protein